MERSARSLFAQQLEDCQDTPVLRGRGLEAELAEDLPDVTLDRLEL